MGSAVSIGKIKIQTRRMGNVSWGDLWGKRKRLKQAIADVVTGNLGLWCEFQGRGGLKIEEVTVNEREIPGGRAIDPTLIDALFGVQRRATSDRWVTGFSCNGKFFPFPLPVYLGSKEEAVDLG